MFFAVTFVALRIFQIITLIPIMGMLAWFVDIYNDRNELTPEPILILFIVSVLAVAWTVFTLFSYHRSSRNARFVTLIDLGFFGALIAAIYELRGIADRDCTSIEEDRFSVGGGGFTLTGPGFEISSDKPCAMLKASWALAIINCILFFITAIVAFLHGDSDHGDRKYSSRSSHHHYRHGHRSSRSRSRSGSHHSSHSHRRVYV
jgi:hypothetical protein